MGRSSSLLALLLFGASPSSADSADSTDRPQPVLECAVPEPPDAKVIAEYCCKVCRKGKACGDSCIARDKTCRVGPGCACDG